VPDRRLFGTDLATVTWTDATCPDGSSASSHSGSCASALAFRFAGLITPEPGSTVKVSAKHVTGYPKWIVSRRRWMRG